LWPSCLASTPSRLRAISLPARRARHVDVLCLAAVLLRLPGNQKPKNRRPAEFVVAFRRRRISAMQRNNQLFQKFPGTTAGVIAFFRSVSSPRRFVNESTRSGTFGQAVARAPVRTTKRRRNDLGASRHVSQRHDGRWIFVCVYRPAWADAHSHERQRACHRVSKYCAADRAAVARRFFRLRREGACPCPGSVASFAFVSETSRVEIAITQAPDDGPTPIDRI